MSIARAAARISSLEHYIWSTTPSAARMIKPAGRLLTPHMDYKANIDARIKKELPRLAAMTTYLYFGYYPQNMAFFPLIKPVLHVSSSFLSCDVDAHLTNIATSLATVNISRQFHPSLMQRYSSLVT
jgi:hypothetical protein